MMKQILEKDCAMLQSMASGLREDALHWEVNSAELFSTEKLQNILKLAELPESHIDPVKLEGVKKELSTRGCLEGC